VIKETLRLHQSEYLYRRVVKPFEFEGYEVPKGWLVRICVRESHRDPKVFVEPERFNPDRFLEISGNRYSPFGMLEHSCNGVPLVHLISRSILEELRQHGNLELTKKSPPVRAFRHWSHWRPSSRIDLSFDQVI
jgi:cytochrome P450